MHIARFPPQPIAMNQDMKAPRRSTFLVPYLLFGILHELSHLAVAYAILPSFHPFASPRDVANFVSRALLGRYCVVELDTDASGSGAVHGPLIRHVGWVFSLALAVGLHCYYRHQSTSSIGSGSAHGENSSELKPIVVLAAYVTALEAITTDLLGFVPFMHQTSASHLFFFCGNFGILLLNPSWINIDGGKRALDMLEKMVEVTMMRGAQSGGVVTFQPDKSGVAMHMNKQATTLRGVRSRVVNAKRTVLSKGVRRKIEKDNCSLVGNNLTGWNDRAFNPNDTGRRLVRGFFGHTRFATSSKASMDGTHPHQWSPRRFYTFYSFQSAATSRKFIQKRGGGKEDGYDEFLDFVTGKSTSSSGRAAVGTGLAEQDKKVMHLAPKPQLLAVENFVTHNGDFEFYKINGKYYDTDAVQSFLVKTLRVPMPATVDSAAIAGMMDLLRVQGSFALSARYAICFMMDGGSMNVNPMDPSIEYMTISQYEEIGKAFERALKELVNERNIKSLEEFNPSAEVLQEISPDQSIRSSQVKSDLRKELMDRVKVGLLDLAQSKLGAKSAVRELIKFVSLDIEAGDLNKFVRATVNAFFDNDLLHSMRIFLENAKGSFGLCVTTSMDAHRQAVFAAKGQTCSVAFYPRKGVICYGSEQAAVKAGLNYETPQGKSMFGTDFKYVDENAVRLDLDDLGGEICLLDWGYGGDNEPAVSPPNRNLAVDKLMGGAVSIVLLRQQSTMGLGVKLHKRLVQLEDNEFIKPLLDDCDDPVLKDIQDIPRICANIQEDWQDVGLNRMTAWHLAQCIQKRMQGRVDGSIHTDPSTVDILVTGCEVSLWVAEQFVADLRKCFPKLGVLSVSSNKLLGLFGQELTMPAMGFPFTHKTLDLKDTIVIIVSHSGGTFSPLACSNLMQSFSSSIFTVTSEWDTQVGKQLRSMYGDKNDLLTSRIFSTEVGVRPAEPCSVSVVATHQLLTNIFGHICMTIISNPHFRFVTGAIITERDLQVLERCNRENIRSLERLVGVNRKGTEIHESIRHMEEELRDAGDLWSEHILENAKAYIMSFIYIVVTVTIGFPLISGIAYAAGLRDDTTPGDSIFYLTRFFDALIYFWLPQINVTILRLVQGRNLRHRMVGRTVVIGDPCPWVAQSAEAFLSKIFACSYSIAGLNVLSGNPADHLVHRHTHRVVRGSLLVCGRPDGRLSALTTLEASTCLAVNQASSIQSIGGTCESITIGHNGFKLPLSKRGIFLETYRPQFLCEKLLDDADNDDGHNKNMKLTATGNLISDRTSYLSSSMHPNSDGFSSSFNEELLTLEEEDNGASPKRAQPNTRSHSSNVDDNRSTGTAVSHEESNGSIHKKQGGSKASRFRTSLSFRRGSSNVTDDLSTSGHKRSILSFRKSTTSNIDDELNISKHRSSASLLGAYSNMEKMEKEKAGKHVGHGVGSRAIDQVIKDMIKEKQSANQATQVFYEMDEDGSGGIDFQEFTEAYKKINPDVSTIQLKAMFQEADIDGNGTLDLDEFLAMTKLPQVDILGKLGVVNRDARGLMQVMPSTEKYFGEELRKTAPKGVGSMLLSQSQHLAMELYESRIASMQRMVAMTVMFHQMGMRVQSFFPNISFGLLGYRMDRTHSIMRIATTASPVSGADVRDSMVELHLRFKIQKAVNLVARKHLEWTRSRAGEAVQFTTKLQRKSQVETEKED